MFIENSDKGRALTFQNAATHWPAWSFYAGFKETLQEIQQSFTRNFAGVQAMTWSRGNKTGFHLYVPHAEISTPDHALTTIFQETFHFHPDDGKIACVRGGLSWRPEQRGECFAQVQMMIMQDLYHFDQQRVRIALKASAARVPL